MKVIRVIRNIIDSILLLANGRARSSRFGKAACGVIQSKRFKEAVSTQVQRGENVPPHPPRLRLFLAFMEPSQKSREWTVRLPEINNTGRIEK